MVKNTKSSTKSAFNKSVSKKATPKSSIAAKSAKVALSSNSANKKSVKVAKTEKVANFKRNRMIVIAVLVITFIGIPSFLYGRSAYEKHQDKQKFLQLAEDIEKLKTDIEKVEISNRCYYDTSDVYDSGRIKCDVIASFTHLNAGEIEALMLKNTSFKKVSNYIQHISGLSCVTGLPTAEKVMKIYCGGFAKDFYYKN